VDRQNRPWLIGESTRRQGTTPSRGIERPFGAAAACVVAEWLSVGYRSTGSARNLRWRFMVASPMVLEARTEGVENVHTEYDYEPEA